MPKWGNSMPNSKKRGESDGRTVQHDQSCENDSLLEAQFPAPQVRRILSAGADEWKRPTLLHDGEERSLKKGKEQPKILKPVSALGARVLRHWRDRAETNCVFEALNPEGMSRGGEAHNKKLKRSLLSAVRRANPHLPPDEQLSIEERPTQDRHKYYDIVNQRGEVLTPYSLRHATSTLMRMCNLSDHAKLAGNWKSMRDRDFDERYSRHEATLMQQPVARSLSQVLDPL